MNAWDFSINYLAGLMFLHGQTPHSEFLYPYPFIYFWAVMALPGPDAMPLMFILWGVVNVGLLIYAFRKDFWKWFFFFPFLHEISSGQVEMLLWIMEREIKPGWRGGIFGALITLKPQTAIVLLPWHLVDWLKHDRKTFIKWVVCTLVLWGLPLLWSPDWLTKWLSARANNGQLAYSASVSPGIFSFLRLSGENLNSPYSPTLLVWLAVLGLISVIVFLVGQFNSSKEIGKACASIASPVGLLYTQMALMGTAPAWLLVPVNLFSVGLSLTLGNFTPALLTPIAVIGWHLYQQRKTKAAEQQLATATT